MTNEKLDEIEARARACSGMGDVHAIVDEDVPALVAEVRRLREGFARLAFAVHEEVAPADAHGIGFTSCQHPDCRAPRRVVASRHHRR